MQLKKYHMMQQLHCIGISKIHEIRQCSDHYNAYEKQKLKNILDEAPWDEILKIYDIREGRDHYNALIIASRS